MDALNKIRTRKINWPYCVLNKLARAHMNKEVALKFEHYPTHVKPQLLQVREWIYQIAERHHLGPVSESLKWGEPSYAVEKGSPIRFDWKSRAPDQWAIYFNCNTKLVSTFRELYPDDFIYQGNRAIALSLEKEQNKAALEHCISLALRYHSLKHLPLLGA